MRRFALVLSLLPSLVFAATPAEGIALKVRRGFFTETDIGTFFTVGGRDNYSNAQMYLQLGLGYDVSEHVEIGFSVAVGSSAANCFGNRDDAGNCNSPFTDPNTRKPIPLAADFTVTMMNASVAYLIRIADRFYVAPKLTGGYSLLDPAPVLRSATEPVTQGPNVGAGVGIEYATSMDHFSIGLDAMFRYVIGPNLATIAVFPRVKYTF